ILREYYEFNKILNDYIKHKNHLPQCPLELKLRRKYEFSIKDKRIALEFIADIEADFYVP
ncbi:26734_t:CDS:1, partial [Gigaspora margarita]